MDTKGVKAVCTALNVLVWKIPRIVGPCSADWWAAELQDKNIDVEWDSATERFIPKRDGLFRNE